MSRHFLLCSQRTGEDGLPWRKLHLLINTLPPLGHCSIISWRRFEAPWRPLSWRAPVIRTKKTCSLAVSLLLFLLLFSFKQNFEVCNWTCNATVQHYYLKMRERWNLGSDQSSECRTMRTTSRSLTIGGKKVPCREKQPAKGSFLIPSDGKSETQLPSAGFWSPIWMEGHGCNKVLLCGDIQVGGTCTATVFFTECKIMPRRAEAPWAIWVHRTSCQVVPFSKFVWTQVNTSITKLFNYQRSGRRGLSDGTYLWPTVLWWLSGYVKICQPQLLLLQNPLLGTIIDSLDLLFAS